MRTQDIQFVIRRFGPVLCNYAILISLLCSIVPNTPVVTKFHLSVGGVRSATSCSLFNACEAALGYSIPIAAIGIWQ